MLVVVDENFVEAKISRSMVLPLCWLLAWCGTHVYNLHSHLLRLIFCNCQTNSFVLTPSLLKENCCINNIVGESGHENVFVQKVLLQRFLYPKTSRFNIGLGKKVSVKLDSKLGKELKKVQKQGRDERTQEDYPTSAKIHTRCRGVFLRSFISALFLYFFQLLP